MEIHTAIRTFDTRLNETTAMKCTPDERTETIIAAQQLIESMVAELRFYGLDSNHRLIRQAAELRNRIARQDLSR